MKIHPLLLAGLTSLLSGVAEAQGPMSVFECRPLTRLNQFECCNAPNWRDIILPGSQARCGRGSGDLEQDDAVGSITPRDTAPPSGPPNGDPPGGDPPGGGPSASGPGNPGNHKDVGKAGEKSMADEGVPDDHPVYGTRGNSN